MRVFKALIISLLVYALLIWLFVTQFSFSLQVPKKINNHVIKIDIRDIPLPVNPVVLPKVKKQVPKKVVKKIVKKTVVKKKPMVKKKPIVKKKVIKKKVVKKKKLIKKKKIVKKKVVKKKKLVVKKKILVKKKPSTREVYVPPEVIQEEIVEAKSKELEAFESEMVYIPEAMMMPERSQKPVDDLSSFLSTPEPMTLPRNYPNKKIRKLYGAEFHDFTLTQKKFIKNNLDSIQQITQRTLTLRGYPDGAAQTGQQGTNVVSFNLHPNGDISNLRLKTRIGYRALDENTLSLIRVAYMDYPYPSTTTKIVFYVTYSIYGY